MLVYDYMANSAECLLDWRRRASIAIGAARALLYLHEHATPQIIYGSIKVTNVLLDSDFQAHVQRQYPTCYDYWCWYIYGVIDQMSKQVSYVQKFYGEKFNSPLEIRHLPLFI
ncbi:PTI1-like tyrosine-protein kinase At3g15890 [Setaria italica]|uniref:PTI1-like tyrosine-protein kinase At3g15890 n=1 Tax=Setaria italica TaxID=4555 RepID=UPI000350D83A|nr:PTI1-like tyrosine-protein kinase At3g15890 [Setaria italica]